MVVGWVRIHLLHIGSLVLGNVLDSEGVENREKEDEVEVMHFNVL